MWNYVVINASYVLVFLLFKVPSVSSFTKTWKPNVNVENPNNWIGGTYSEDCSGLIFPESLKDICMMGVKDIVTSEIVLPREGDIFIQEGGHISFSENAAKCIRLKQLQYEKWNNPDNWLSDQVNKAVPDVERIPCQCDDVVFPEGSVIAVDLPTAKTLVNSINMYGRKLWWYQWIDILRTIAECKEFKNTFHGWAVSVMHLFPHYCRQKDGIVCQFNEKSFQETCFNIDRNNHKTECSKPIKPIGHCRNFCGGVLHIVPNDNFDLNAFRENLPRYDGIDSYASKVARNNDSVIQLVLTDKESFNGDSVLTAQSLFTQLKGEMENWKLKSVTLEVSGLPYNPRKVLGNAISIIFGTFLAAVAVFASIYMVYAGPLRNYSFRPRLPFSSVSAPTVSRFTFARFQNKDDGGLSMGGSIISLGKAFENPMYGRPRPSTSTITSEILPEQGKQSTSTELTYENPLFFGQAKKQSVDGDMEEVNEEDSEE